jgi:hypothetical protein
VSNLLYLVGAVFLSAVVIGVLWLRNRKPQSTEWAIESFQRELRALAPDKRPPERERRHPG